MRKETVVSKVTDEQLHRVERSYGRCTLSAGFFDDFYRNFLGASPAIAPYFSKTDMAKQKQLLRAGISHMILAAKGNSISQKKIKQLGESHNRQHFNVKPALYKLWEQSLLKTVQAHDPDYGIDLQIAWHNVLSIGVEQIKSAY